VWEGETKPHSIYCPPHPPVVRGRDVGGRCGRGSAFLLAFLHLSCLPCSFGSCASGCPSCQSHSPSPPDHAPFRKAAACRANGYTRASTGTRAPHSPACLSVMVPAKRMRSFQLTISRASHFLTDCASWPPCPLPGPITNACSCLISQNSASVRRSTALPLTGKAEKDSIMSARRLFNAMQSKTGKKRSR
jgi:hypothetical protein